MSFQESSSEHLNSGMVSVTVVIVGSESLVAYHLSPALLSITLAKGEVNFVFLNMEPHIDSECGRIDWRFDSESQWKLKELAHESQRVIALIDVDDWQERVPVRWLARWEKGQREIASDIGRHRATRLQELARGWQAKLIALSHVSVLGCASEILHAASTYLPGLHTVLQTPPLLVAEMSLSYEATLLAGLNAGDIVATVVPGSIIGPCNLHHPTRTGIALVDGYSKLRPYLDRRAVVVDVRDLCKSLAKLTISPLLTGRFLLGGHLIALSDLYRQLGLIPDSSTSTPDTYPLFPTGTLTIARWAQLIHLTRPPSLETLLWQSSGYSLDEQRAITELGFTKRPLEKTLSETKLTLQGRGGC